MHKCRKIVNTLAKYTVIAGVMLVTAACDEHYAKSNAMRWEYLEKPGLSATEFPSEIHGLRIRLPQGARVVDAPDFEGGAKIISIGDEEFLYIWDLTNNDEDERRTERHVSSFFGVEVLPDISKNFKNPPVTKVAQDYNKILKIEKLITIQGSKWKMFVIPGRTTSEFFCWREEGGRRFFKGTVPNSKFQMFLEMIDL